MTVPMAETGRVVRSGGREGASDHAEEVRPDQGTDRSADR